ncbi:hypothetical protein HaLaN_03669 [Haematococcus lacustris]|uniref:Uncharacterized protein n=1 Tax=Haematococcus lacustris TaxID=44745 RepID=A0A699YEU8_HAELA|nr:hypothetical protein HaLaN_03669 [Haematococcus lacustris]
MLKHHYGAYPCAGSNTGRPSHDGGSKSVVIRTFSKMQPSFQGLATTASTSLGRRRKRVRAFAVMPCSSAIIRRATAGSATLQGDTPHRPVLPYSRVPCLAVWLSSPDAVHQLICVR